MADVTKVKASNGQIFNINDEDDYTKEEVDTLLAGKSDVGDSYTKAEEDALLADKANSVDVTGELALKANVVDVYSKTEADNLLAGKADVGVSYTKAEDDALLAGKADVGDSYTKAEDDALLADKADVSSLDDYTLKATFTQFQSDVNVEFQNRYTKTEDDTLLANKANSSDVYTKAEVDALIRSRTMKALDYANSIDLETASTTFVDTTVPKDGMLILNCATGNPNDVTVDGVSIWSHATGASSSAGVACYELPLKQGQIISVKNFSSATKNESIKFVPYFD